MRQLGWELILERKKWRIKSWRREWGSWRRWGRNYWDWFYFLHNYKDEGLRRPEPPPPPPLPPKSLFSNLKNPFLKKSKMFRSVPDNIHISHAKQGKPTAPIVHYGVHITCFRRDDGSQWGSTGRYQEQKLQSQACGQSKSETKSASRSPRLQHWRDSSKKTGHGVWDGGGDGEQQECIKFQVCL